MSHADARRSESLARDAPLSQATAHRYLNLLETSCQIVRQPAFAVSRTERLVKTPKLYWTDTGLAARLAWRTHGGAEVDFVIEAGRRLLPVEVKSARRIRLADAGGLASFVDEHPKSSPLAILLRGGEEVFSLTERILAVPVGCLWS